MTCQHSMTRLICWFLVSVAACLATVSVASAERRVALVLGNAAYHNTPRLLNPVRDAESIVNKLRELDFEVIVGLDLATSETQARIAQFARQVRGADIAVFYYAGHALQLSGANYLIPVNAELKDDTSLDFEAVPLDFILRQMSRVAMGRTLPPVEEPVTGRGIAEEIEDLLQARLETLPEYRDRSVHVRPSLNGVRIEVDNKAYEGIGEVDDPAIHALLLDVVREWENQQ